MLRRPFARLVADFAVASLWCGSAAVLAACNGGSATRPPLFTGAPPPSSAPTSAGLFAGIAPTTSGTLSTPIPLPTPASGAYTLAGLSTSLDASTPPAPGSAVGTIGIVTATGASSVTVTQVPMFAPNDASGNPIPYVNNVPQTGSFKTALTINADSNTVFANAGGLAQLVPGTMVAAAGSATSPSALHATLLVPLAYGHATMPSSRRIASAGLAPAARRSLAYDTTVASAFARKVDNLGPAFKYNAAIVHLDSSKTACTNLLGKPTGPQGTFSLSLVPQAVLSLGELDVHFPFNVSYASMPPLFVQNGNSFSGPGSPTGWMAFAGKAGQNQYDYTAQLAAGADLGLSVTISSTCPGAQTVTLASATLGYAIQSGTTDALPGPSQKTQLKAIACIGINEPVNINLFFDPASGFPNLNPFGDFTAANLSFCDQPTIGGALVTGSTNNVVNGSITPSSFAFDPSQAGSGSISSFGAITPIGTPLSLNLTNLQYQPSYNDQYQLVYTVLGIPLVSTPGGVPFHVRFAPLTAQNIPVTIHATPQGLCATVYSGEVFGQPTGCAPGAINVVLCNKPNPTPNDMCQSGVTSSAEVAVSDPGFTGQLVIANDLSASCATVQSTDPITVTPQSAAGPTATFQITAGPQQVPDGQPMDCNVYIEQPANVPVILAGL